VIDGCHIRWDRFSDLHGFAKPNDERALRLMDHAARDVMQEYKDIVLGFGESDEFRCAQHISFTKNPLDDLMS
jgi:tRNA(His) 5'-end guanylyltransferase